jgi:predicted nucleotidyltransferase
MVSSCPTGRNLDDVTEPVRGVLAELTAKRDMLHRVAARHGAVHLWVFGSVARGEEQADSDIDFIAEFEPGRSLFDLMDLERDLTDLLGRHVDVVSLGGLKPRDERIRREMLAL